MTNIKEQTRKLTEQLTDRGKIIEGGWLGFRLAVIPEEASAVQVDEMRKSFFAGATHLFMSIMGILEPGSEPTEKDLARMDSIHREILAFQDHLRDQITGAKQ